MLTPDESKQIADIIAKAGSAVTHKVLLEGIGDAAITAVLTVVLVLMGLLAWYEVKTGDNTPGEAVMLWVLVFGVVLLMALYFGASALVEIGAPDGVAIERILRGLH